MPASVPTACRLTQSEAPLLHAASARVTSPAVASLLTGLLQRWSRTNQRARRGGGRRLIYPFRGRRG